MAGKDKWTQFSSNLSGVLSGVLSKAEAKKAMQAVEENKEKLSVPKNGRSGKKKDKNAPTRARSAYIFFCSAKRAEYKASGKELDTKEVLKKIGEDWHKISDKEKAKYQALAEKDKKRYSEEMSSYVPTEQSDDEEKPKRGKGAKKKDGPKNPKSSYMFFCQEQRDKVKADNPEMKPKEIASELGRLWRELSDEEKVPYQKMNEQDKIRFNNEKGITEEKGAEKPAKKKTTKKAETKAETKTESKPEKKTEKKSEKKAIKKTPGYNLFYSDQAEELNDLHPDWKKAKITEEIERLWRGLSQEDIDEYEENAAQDSEDEDVLEEQDD